MLHCFLIKTSCCASRSPATQVSLQWCIFSDENILFCQQATCNPGQFAAMLHFAVSAAGFPVLCLCLGGPLFLMMHGKNAGERMSDDSDEAAHLICCSTVCIISAWQVCKEQGDLSTHKNHDAFFWLVCPYDRIIFILDVCICQGFFFLIGCCWGCCWHIWIFMVNWKDAGSDLENFHSLR